MVFVAASGPGGVDGLGPLGLLGQAGQPLRGEGVQGVAGGLRRAAQGGGDLGGPLALVAGEKDLAATQSEGVRRAQPLAERGTLGFRKGPNEQRWLHTSFYAAHAFANGVPLKCIRPLFAA